MDREEAARLVEQYSPAVYRQAYARTGSREDAEDITQETFLRLVRTAPVFRDGEHCKAWLLRVAANCAGDLHRSLWRRRAVPLEEAGQMELLPEKLRQTAALRSAHPELTLSELAAEFDPPVTKSGLNHRLRKLVQLASEL